MSQVTWTKFGRTHFKVINCLYLIQYIVDQKSNVNLIIKKSLIQILWHQELPTAVRPPWGFEGWWGFICFEWEYRVDCGTSLKPKTLRLVGVNKRMLVPGESMVPLDYPVTWLGSWARPLIYWSTGVLDVDPFEHGLLHRAANQLDKSWETALPGRGSNFSIVFALLSFVISCFLDSFITACRCFGLLINVALPWLVLWARTSTLSWLSLIQSQFYPVSVVSQFG